MMQLKLAGGGIMSAYHPHDESNLDKLVNKLRQLGKWIKDTLNQKGIP